MASVHVTLALPARFTQDLKTKEASEGATAVLQCELSKVAPVKWKKGPETIRDGDCVLCSSCAMCFLTLCTFAHSAMVLGGLCGSLCVSVSCPQSPPDSLMISVTDWSFPALPARFIEDVRNQEAREGATVVLQCELSKAAPVEWRKGSETLRDGDRYSLRQDGTRCELQICGLAMEDTGEYLCVCGQERTSATLTVRGKDLVWSCGLVAWDLRVYVITFCFRMWHFCGNPEVL
ncbi:hypothetical protein P7K49_035296 [Saguinus oedipus]|uniref:Ig-like domain-containing protein n=1 Tax=Saguinus oedipus TaxID=9490 RepID=A0ABQ9TM94_SAGOE|nr:hypothetical protein P7K49_035296 [Saguinus oedipus]